MPGSPEVKLGKSIYHHHFSPSVVKGMRVKITGEHGVRKYKGGNLYESIEATLEHFTLGSEKYSRNSQLNFLLDVTAPTNAWAVRSLEEVSDMLAEDDDETDEQRMLRHMETFSHNPIFLRAASSSNIIATGDVLYFTSLYNQQVYETIGHITDIEILSVP